MHDDDCVPAPTRRTDWPQQEFLAWLDGIKRQHRLGNDARLADHLGIHYTLISGWRSGRQRPSNKTINIIAEATGTPVHVLMELAGLVRPSGGSVYGARVLPPEVQDLVDALASADGADREDALRGIALIVRGLRRTSQTYDAGSAI